MSSNAAEIWEQMLGKLETVLSIVDFDVWITRLEPVTINGSKLILLAPSKPNKDFIDSHYRPLIMSIMSGINPLLTEFEIIEPSEKEKYENQTETEVVDEKEPQHRMDAMVINPK